MAHDVEKVIQPIEDGMSKMEREIEAEQSEITGIEAARHAVFSPVSAPELRFKIPGSISIDHLKLPEGAYSISLGRADAADAATVPMRGGRGRSNMHTLKRSGASSDQDVAAAAARIIKKYRRQPSSASEGAKGVHDLAA